MFLPDEDLIALNDITAKLKATKGLALVSDPPPPTKSSWSCFQMSNDVVLCSCNAE